MPQSSKPNKFEYLWVIQQYHKPGYGWEDVDTCETWKECRVNIRAYREAEPQYQHRVIRRRELNQEYQEPSK